MAPDCTHRPGKDWTAEQRRQIAEYICSNYVFTELGSGQGGMRQVEFERIPVRFFDVGFDYAKHDPVATWASVLEKLGRGYDPAKETFDRWFQSMQLLGSLEGRRPDHLDFPGKGWRDAERAEAFIYVRGTRPRDRNRTVYYQMIHARVRWLGKQDDCVGRQEQWVHHDLRPEDFRGVFDEFDPGRGSFELWWLTNLCWWAVS